MFRKLIDDYRSQAAQQLSDAEELESGRWRIGNQDGDQSSSTASSNAPWATRLDHKTGWHIIENYYAKFGKSRASLRYLEVANGATRTNVIASVDTPRETWHRRRCCTRLAGAVSSVGAITTCPALECVQFQTNAASIKNPDDR